MQKSTMQVVPPATPEAVPTSKSSALTVPMKPSSMCTCGSIKPGGGNAPVASIVSSPLSGSSLVPIYVIVPVFEAQVGREALGCGDHLAVVDDDAHDSSGLPAPAAVTRRFLVSCLAGDEPPASVASQIGQSGVGLGPAVAEELPGLAHLVDRVEVHLRHDQGVVVLVRLRQEAAARVDEVRRAVELADVPGRLGADAVDRADEVAVGDRVRRLLELPQVLARVQRRWRSG